MFFLKPKKTGMPSPFHQDNFYWNIINAEALNLWIALTESNKNNGGLCYLQESHNLGTVKLNKHKIQWSHQRQHDFITSNLTRTPPRNPGQTFHHQGRD